jgi:hypothetical protein
VVPHTLIPIAGVVFLHWSVSNLLIVYFAGTLAAFSSVSVLAAGRFVFIVSAGFLQPQRGGLTAAIFGFVLVLAYALATIAMELQPSRLLAWFGADDLVPGGATTPQSDATAGTRSRRRN